MAFGPCMCGGCPRCGYYEEPECDCEAPEGHDHEPGCASGTSELELKERAAEDRAEYLADLRADRDIDF